MNRTSLVALATAGLAAAAVLAPGQSSSLGLGVDVGLYFPSSTRVRNAFSDELVNYGLGSTGTNRPGNGSFTPDLSLQTGNSNGNVLFMGSFTYGYEYEFEKANRPLVPYIRPFLGATYFDFGITEDTGRVSLKRLGYTYGLELGVVITRKIRVAARYNVYSSEDSFNFNGFTLMLTYAFL